MLQKISENITPLGVLIVEGYNPTLDWLNMDTFFSIVSNLSINQTYLFSSNKEMESNEYIQELIKQKRIVLIRESFAEYFNNLKETGFITNQIVPYDNYDGHAININSKRVKIPSDVYNKISKSALLIETSLFETSSNLSEDDRFILFKNFLADSFPMPKWKGYPLNFFFKRGFYDDLKNKVMSKLSSNHFNTPIILHGQASAGKTMALGQLAYELFKETRLPVLFIERKYTRLDDHDILGFYDWAEQNGADKMIVIWDGMHEASLYLNFSKRLESRGKNILMICSSYKIISSRNLPDYFIEAPINLSNLEIKNFQDYLDGYYPGASILVKHFKEDNFLAMLYRYLDEARPVIKDSLNKEVDSTSKHISTDLTTPKKEVKIDSNSLAFHLQKAGIISDQALIDFEKEIEIAGDTVTISRKLINLVMVPGQFGLLVPFDLLIRSIGLNSFNQDVFKAFQRHDILKWYDDSVGNISISARTTFEAQLIVRTLGGYQAQAEYVKDLILAVRDFNNFGYSEFSENGQGDIQFVAELLYHLSPNSGNNSFIPYLYEFSLALTKLRESGQVINPRLMLQEAAYLRELVMERVNPSPLSHHELLDRAEIILRDAIQRVMNKKSSLYKMLQVELSTILGSKLKEELNKSAFNIEEARTYYLAAYGQLVNTGLLGINSYHALDVLVWTTCAALRYNILTPEQRLSVEIMVLHLFDLYDSEGVEEIHYDEFLKRQLEFAEELNREDLSKEALRKLEEIGSSAGYYLQAKRLIGNVSLNQQLSNDADRKVLEAAYDFLEKNITIIANDAACCYLSFKLWWILNTGHGLISGERQVLPFDLNKWHKCQWYLELLKSFGDNFYTSTVKYLHGICLFHIGELQQSISLFKELDSETDFSLLGKKRVVKSYIASGLNGKAQVYTGEARYSVSKMNNLNKGEIYVPILRIPIPFILRDFNLREVIAKQAFPSFYIGFNFRGLIAVPVK